MSETPKLQVIQLNPYTHGHAAAELLRAAIIARDVLDRIDLNAVPRLAFDLVSAIDELDDAIAKAEASPS